jgi:hypothetical protein
MAKRKASTRPRERQAELPAQSLSADPLPAPLAHAIWLHQVVFDMSRGDSAWWIWYGRHEAYCEELSKSQYYEPYLGYRKIYTDASHCRPGAREGLDALLARMPGDTESMRLALLACEDAIDQAREELDRAEEFVTVLGRLLSQGSSA